MTTTQGARAKLLFTMDDYYIRVLAPRLQGLFVRGLIGEEVYHYFAKCVEAAKARAGTAAPARDAP